MKCYFCSLREPLKVPLSDQDIKKNFPTLKTILDISNDLREMDYNIEFVVVDMRKKK